MNVLSSLEIDKKMFKKLLRIGFIMTYDTDKRYGFVKDINHFIIRSCDNVTYDKTSLISIQFCDMDKEMFKKLVKIGAVNEWFGEKQTIKTAKQFFCDKTKYYFSGWLFGKIRISTLTYDVKTKKSSI